MTKFIKIGLQKKSQVILNIEQIVSIEKNGITKCAVIVMTNGLKYHTDVQYDNIFKLEWMPKLSKWLPKISN